MISIHADRIVPAPQDKESSLISILQYIGASVSRKFRLMILMKVAGIIGSEVSRYYDVEAGGYCTDRFEGLILSLKSALSAADYGLTLYKMLSDMEEEIGLSICTNKFFDFVALQLILNPKVTNAPGRAWYLTYERFPDLEYHYSLFATSQDAKYYSGMLNTLKGKLSIRCFDSITYDLLT